MTVDYTKPYQPPPQQPPPPAPPGYPPPSKSSGCLKLLGIGCVVVMLASIAFVAGVFYFVFHLIKSSEVYQEGLHRAQQNAEVQAALGTPIEPGWWVMGNVNLNDDGGHANIHYPIEGPKGKAEVHVIASRSRSQWVYDTITVEPDATHRKIDLTR